MYIQMTRSSYAINSLTAKLLMMVFFTLSVGSVSLLIVIMVGE